MRAEVPLDNNTIETCRDQTTRLAIRQVQRVVLVSLRSSLPRFKPVDVADSAVLVARDDKELDPGGAKPDFDRIVFSRHRDQLLILGDGHRLHCLRLVVSEL